MAVGARLAYGGQVIVTVFAVQTGPVAAIMANFDWQQGNTYSYLQVGERWVLWPSGSMPILDIMNESTVR